jgi:hypothetical protein
MGWFGRTAPEPVPVVMAQAVVDDPWMWFTDHNDLWTVYVAVRTSNVRNTALVEFPVYSYREPRKRLYLGIHRGVVEADRSDIVNLPRVERPALPDFFVQEATHALL